MAFTVQNTPIGVLVPRGKPTQLGTVSAANQSFQFQIAPPHGAMGNCPNGTDAIIITTGGNLSGSGQILEGSIDGGTSWFAITVVSGTPSSVPVVTVTVLTGDTAATSANTYVLTGLTGATLFRVGFGTYTSGSGAIWVYCA